jgi:hypothetical protein
MATYYVRSGAGGAGTGADWANAFTTLTLAFSGKAAGDIFYVAGDHAESTASAVTLTAPGSLATPSYVYCVSHTGTVPPVSADLRTTATVATTGNSQLAIQGICYWYGITFNCASGANAANFIVGATAGQHIRFVSCNFNHVQTGAGITIIGTQSQLNGRLIFDNCTFGFTSTAQTMLPRGCEIIWNNTASAITGGTLPTTLFTNAGPAHANVLISGVDLSALGSGKTIAHASYQGAVKLLGCKLGSSVTISGGPTTVGTGHIDVINCDSGATNYRTERYRYEGTQTVETTIVRTGGATDGTTPIAWKLVTTANSRWHFPFTSMPMAIWNDTTGGSKTVTVYGIWGGGAVPLNDEIWIEVRYPDSGSFPSSTIATSTKADALAAGTNITADSSTWGGSTTDFKMEATFTPQMKGPLYIVVRAAKASSTFYIDPKPVVT